MSKLAGYSVLALGVLGLGTWGTVKHAHHMEDHVAAAAMAVAQGASTPLDLVVSGRDITVSGLVESEAEAQALGRALDQVEGHRVLRTDLRLPEIADPHRITVTRDDAGVLMADGMVPSQAGRAVLAEHLDAAGLDLRRGAVDGWDQAIGAGVEALGALETGQVDLSGEALHLRGTALNPTQRALAIAALDVAPETVTLSHEIDVLDDGAPFVFKATAGDAPSVAGKLPVGFDTAALPDGDWVQSALSGPEGYAGNITAGLAALSHLEHGDLSVDADGLRLSGVARDPQAQAAAQAALADLPVGVEVDLDVLDDGTPFEFSASKGDLFSAVGKLPADLDLSGVEIPVADFSRSALPGPDGYAGNVTAGLAALGHLERGDLSVDANGLRLTGTAANAEAEAAAWAALPDGAQAEITVAQAPVQRFAWSIAGGVEDAENLSPEAVEAALRGAGDDLGEASPALAALAPWMANVEALRYGPEGVQVTLAPGVDADQVRDALAADLGDVALTLEPAQAQPADGAERVNLFTGDTETFAAGFWIPRLDFSPTRESCAAQADMVLGRGEITFLSGSATLDARSTRAVNLLAAVLRHCDGFTEAGVEIGGHTDSTGDAALNQQLSQDRAQAVVDALAARGVDPARMTPRGYGAELPIADNATEEGRAANRRTTITWAE